MPTPIVVISQKSVMVGADAAAEVLLDAWAAADEYVLLIENAAPVPVLAAWGDTSPVPLQTGSLVVVEPESLAILFCGADLTVVRLRLSAAGSGLVMITQGCRRPHNPVAGMGLSAEGLVFPDTVVGQSSVRTIVVTNIGTVPLVFTTLAASGDFSVAGV